MSPIAVLFLLAALLLPAAAPAADEAKHSGSIVALGAGGREITLEEVGAWTPRIRPSARTIEIRPDTRIVEAARAGEPAPGQWPGGLRETPLAAADLRAGEYVTVITARRDGRLVALSVTVVAPK